MGDDDTVIGTARVKRDIAEMIEGGVLIDVVAAERERIVEGATGGD